MRKLPALIVVAAVLASGCAASARPYPGPLDARFTAYQRASPCCEDPAGFDYASLPEAGTLEVVIGSVSPVFEFQSGRSHFAAFRIPEAERPYRVRVRSLFDNPTTDGASVFYPVLAMMDDTFIVTRMSNLDSLRLEQALTVPGGEAGLVVTAPFDPGVAKEKYLVVFTPAVMLGAPPPERRDGDVLTVATRQWLEQRGDALVEASPYGRLSISVAPIDPPGPG